MKVYAIGDIHGCYDELRTLIKRIKVDADNKKAALVFTGDYVDRGPYSKQVIDFIIDLQKSNEFEVTALRGNHEDMMVFYEEDWLYDNRGGKATIASYGQKPSKVKNVYNLVGSKHYNWLENLPFAKEIGKCFFAHAGANPKKDFYHQNVYDLVWARYNHNGAWKEDRCVIHGHTPTVNFRVECVPHWMRPTRINIDSGCVFGGVLSAIRIDNPDYPSVSKVITVESTKPLTKGNNVYDAIF